MYQVSRIKHILKSLLVEEIKRKKILKSKFEFRKDINIF